MNFKEIANRITGFSFPLFGISWNPPLLEIQTAKKIIIFLEDKRVLYNPYQLENPEYCVQSVLKIREFLTEQLYNLNSDSELAVIVKSMRGACRRFLDITTKEEWMFKRSEGKIGNHLGLGEQIVFYSGMGELRGTMGVLISKVLIMHGIDCDGDLLKILPLEVIDI